ncbi:hypothetical protein AB0M46_06180 [Dactylosporangium sp. NPDC051485]|uniref:hypothetical protein n=1 Tax=Dactylosporangium sp. NPDC051485 TaxID=3154846 RepID=UPI00342E9CC8
MAGRAELPGAVLAEMVGAGGPRAEFTVVGNRACPADVLLGVYFRARWSAAEGAGLEHVRMIAALDAVEHRNFPPDVLGLLARGFAPLVPGGYEAVAAAMRNPSLPGDGALLGSRDSRVAVRASVAANPAISARIVRALRSDERSEVRLALAGNPAVLDPGLRESLLEGVVALRSDAVAGLDGLPRELIPRLVGLVSDAGWRALAGNPSVPALVVERMLAQAATADRRAWAELALLRRRECPPGIVAKFAADVDFRRRALAAASPGLSGRHRDLLAGDGQALVRAKVAADPGTPPEMLESLAADADRSVRAGVARNPATPATLLPTLSRDDDRIVVLTAARHANLPISEMRAIVQGSAARTT